MRRIQSIHVDRFRIDLNIDNLLLQDENFVPFVFGKNVVRSVLSLPPPKNVSKLCNFNKKKSITN